MKRFFWILLIIFLLFLFLSINVFAQIEKIKPLVDQYIKAWNTGNSELFTDVVSPDFEIRHPKDFKPMKGIQYLKDYLAETRKIVPDFFLTKTGEIVTDTALLVTWNIKGTVQSSGDQKTAVLNLDIPGFSIIYFSEERLTGEWIAYSDLLWAEQEGYKLSKP